MTEQEAKVMMEGMQFRLDFVRGNLNAYIQGNGSSDALKRKSADKLTSRGPHRTSRLAQHVMAALLLTGLSILLVAAL